MIKFFKNLFIRFRSRKLNKKALRDLVKNQLVLENLSFELPDLDFKAEMYKNFKSDIFDVSDIRCIVKENPIERKN